MTGRTRRVLLRTLFASTVSLATATALAPVVAATRTSRPGGGTDGRAPGPAYDVLFDEMYRGRHIHGHRLTDTVSLAARPAAHGHGGRPRTGPLADGGHAGTPGMKVRVDGRTLHLMRRADGSYLSMVDHYRSYPTPLAATRAAVDALGTARLARAV